MSWQISIRYPDGHEQAVCAYTNRETALKHIDAICAHNKPMTIAYVLRPTNHAVAC